MFIAKFNQTTSAPFTTDKNGNMPFIGQLLAGKAHSTIVNGTVFTRENLSTGKMYLCSNTQVEFTNPDTGEITKVWNTNVISEVSVVELLSAKQLLGDPVMIPSKQDSDTVNETANKQEDPALL